MKKVLVILKDNIKSLGKKGEVIEVKEGYANNLLFPKGLAEIYNSSNAKKLEKEKSDACQKEAKIVKEANSIKDKLEGKSITIKVKVGKDDRLFGSVSHKDIADAILQQLGVAVDKKRIHSEEMKQLLNYDAKIKLHSKVFANISVHLSAK